MLDVPKTGGTQNTPADGRQPYLKGGPTTDLDLGPGQTNLLEALRDETRKTAELRAENMKLREQLKDIGIRLVRSEQEREREHAGRVTAEANRATTAEKLNDRDARILNLALEKAKLEQDVLLAKIAAAEMQLEAQLQHASPPAPDDRGRD